MLPGFWSKQTGPSAIASNHNIAQLRNRILHSLTPAQTQKGRPARLENIQIFSIPPIACYIPSMYADSSSHRELDTYVRVHAVAIN